MRQNNIEQVITVITNHGFAYEPIVKNRYNTLPPEFPEITSDQRCLEGMYIHQIRNGKMLAFYYYPTTGTWRAKGKTKTYRSKNVVHLMSLLIPRSSKIDNLLKD